MTPLGPIKLVSQLLDLPLIDSDGCYCGIVDDIDLKADGRNAPKIDALLVGPGAYAGRLPAWSMWIVRQIAGNRVVRIPWRNVATIGASVHLACPASDVGLGNSEAAARRWIPQKGAL